MSAHALLSHATQVELALIFPGALRTRQAVADRRLRSGIVPRCPRRRGPLRRQDVRAASSRPQQPVRAAERGRLSFVVPRFSVLAPGTGYSLRLDAETAKGTLLSFSYFAAYVNSVPISALAGARLACAMCEQALLEIEGVRLTTQVAREDGDSSGREARIFIDPPSGDRWRASSGAYFQVGSSQA